MSSAVPPGGFRNVSPEHGDNKLMGQVVRLAERVARRSDAHPSRLPLGESSYYCMRCEADRFLLYPGGEVQCASCGAQIENLAVAEQPRGAPGPEL
jgi:DNA-directed RNA polymerase subunit RPC12/RpoP